ncbi:MAG: hypothetical protein R3250_00540 [Melioribacteraceae bacterium]|nr:hypothetical protein [Melioribacteraceae bacterium]
MLHILKNILVVLTIIFTLSGCSGSSPGFTDSEVSLSDIKEFSIVEMVNDDRLLIGSTFFSINKDTKLKKADQSDLQIDEIKQGDLVYFEAHDEIMTSFPGQGGAIEVVLQNDEESKKVSDNIRHFIENQKTGDILSISIIKLSDESIKLHFYEWEIHGKKYEAEIDRLTNEFTVTEIPNEEALEQERLNKEMAAAHPEGSTAGHITEIYEDGFRVNMVDYTFADDVQLLNDKGNVLEKDDFFIGSFVSVDYDKVDHKEIIGKGVLSKITSITKEENPEVRSWIESIFKSDLYIDPVILANFVDVEHRYYTIRVADLKDDTWDSFNITYDTVTDTHSIERVKN